jgi:HEAT repeat protein
MFETLLYAPQQQSMLSALEQALRESGAGPEQIARLQELIQQLDWESQTMEEKLRQAQEQGRLWQITLDQRLRFLRRLLDEGRVEGLLALVEQILEALRSEDVAHRELAAQTLTGVARWIEDPGLPVEAEGPIIEGLAAHFGWEPLAHIHRASTEALAVVVASEVNRGEPGQALSLLRELSGLCAFQEARQDWRESGLAGLWAGLSNPAYLAKVTELLHTASAETMMGELLPFLEAVGLPAARFLVEVLGEEPERKRRARLLEAIRSMGETALPAVYEGLESPTWYLVRNTLNLLSDMSDAGALGPVGECLAHPDGRVKRAAVRAIWKLGGPLAVTPLLAALPQVDPETQSEIMFALVQVRAVQAVAPLAAYALDKRNPELMRARAAETIGQIGDPRSIPSLVEIAGRKGRLFTTAEPLPVRLAACKSLLAMDSSAAWEALCEVVAAEPWHRDRKALQQIVNTRRG